MKTRKDLCSDFSNLFKKESLKDVTLIDLLTIARVISDTTYVHLGDFSSLFLCFDIAEVSDEYEKKRLRNNASSAFNSILKNLEEAYEKYQDTDPKAEMFFAVYVISGCLFLDEKSFYSDEKASEFYPTAKKIVEWCRVFDL